MRDSFTLASLLITDRDKDNVVAWHESLATIFDSEVEDAFQSHSSGDFRAKVIEVGVGLALRAGSGFISLLHRIGVGSEQIEKVMPWYHEQLASAAVEVWFPAATKRFGLIPIRQHHANIRSVLWTKPVMLRASAKQEQSVTFQRIEAQKWHQQTELVVRHLENIAVCSATERQAAICAMAGDLFDNFVQDRVKLVRSFNDLPDFEAEMKTYGPYLISPEMSDIDLTEAEIAGKKTMLSARRRDWLARARKLLEAQSQVEQHPSESPAAKPRKRGFEADRTRHELVSKIVGQFEKEWKKRLPEICVELETVGVKFPLRWKTEYNVRTWTDIADDFFERGASKQRGLLKKWLEASVKWKLDERGSSK